MRRHAQESRPVFVKPARTQYVSRQPDLIRQIFSLDPDDDRFGILLRLRAHMTARERGGDWGQYNPESRP
jgi:hypothetical protein